MMMNVNGNGMAPFNNMVGRMPNGVAPNDLKRAAVNNRNPYVGAPHSLPVATLIFPVCIATARVPWRT
jgi:hypothetical protein